MKINSMAGVDFIKFMLTLFASYQSKKFKGNLLWSISYTGSGFSFYC